MLQLVCCHPSLRIRFIISSTTATQSLGFPHNPLPRLSIPGYHPPSLDHRLPQITHHTIHPPKFRFPHSPACFEFQIHYSSGYFIIAHSLQVRSPLQPCCFNRLQILLRHEIITNRSLSLDYLPFPFLSSDVLTFTRKMMENDRRYRYISQLRSAVRKCHMKLDSLELR